MTPSIDDFELFGLRRRFALERGELDARRRVLQAEVHPDRFANADAAARRAATQWAVRVNEGHARLGDPLRRAAYLCELAGAPVRAEDNTAMPAAFLQQQMAWREGLDDAASRDEVQAIARALADERKRGFARLASTLDAEHDYERAAQEVRALMFIERFAADVERRLDALEA